MSSRTDLSVLVVEDDEDIADLISSALQSKGLTVQCADCGRDGLTAAIEHRPDLIITDYLMPNMGGIGMVQELRSNPRTSGIPVLMISALPVDDDIPVDASLLKPFTLTQLFDTIDRLTA